MLDFGTSDFVRAPGEPELPDHPLAVPTAEPARPLRIGLLNNMPDAALVATERQFRRLLGSRVALELFTLEDMPRGPEARAYLARGYAPHSALLDARLDALVITGCEPRAGRLDAEPYYASFTKVVNWAMENTVSTLFSCLAAHAAVLHLHGIERRPQPSKLWGVFECATLGTHPLLAGMPASVTVPHSRWNDLAEEDLTAHGYRVLRRSPRVGVDLFLREGPSLLVFLQGHPEYDADSLAREYRRDMGRFLDGTRETCPPLPEGYYTAEAEQRLEAFAELARARRDPALQAAFPSLTAALPRTAGWRNPGVRLFRNWLALVSRRRSGAFPPAYRSRLA